MSGGLSGSVTDTGTGTDSVSATAGAPGSVTDAGTGTDALTSTAAAGSGVTDTGTGTDALSGTAAAGAGVTDAGTGTDALASTATASAGVADTGAGSDAVAGAIAGGPAMPTTGTPPVNTTSTGVAPPGTPPTSTAPSGTTSTGTAPTAAAPSQVGRRTSVGAVVPSDQSAFLDASGALAHPWRQFFAKLASPPAQVSNINVSTSPAVFAASTRGTMIIGSGQVTGMKLTRGRVDVPLSPTIANVPMGAGDILTVAFAQPPSLVFVPS